MKRALLLAALTGAPVAAQEYTGQDSWSDSKPNVMELGRQGCPLKVRGKSGQWAPFEGDIPVGRKVMGAVNPRRPDVVFFQLRQDSPFMFAAPRTCFKGEEYWSDDPVQTAVNTPEDSVFAFTGLQFFNERPRVKSTVTGSTAPSYELRSKVTGGCLGLGMDFKRQNYSFGGGGCFGYGFGYIKSVDKDFSYEVKGTKIWYLQALGLAYYDFPDMPYGVGLEGSLGFMHAPWPSTNVNYKISSRNSINWTLAAGWRFYIDEWWIAPKIGFYKWPRNLYFELGLAYRFGESQRSKFLEPK